MSKPISMIVLGLTICLFVAANADIINLGPSQDLNQIIQSNPKTIIVFYASWCGPCRRLMPNLEKIANEKPEITLIKVNTDELSNLISQWNVNGLPTTVLVKNGQTIGRFSGSESSTIDKQVAKL